MIKILIVVPYLELQQAFEEVIHKFDLQDLSVSTTHIFGTDPQVIEPLNADIIVARGITASAIALQKPSVHVVPINWSNADLLSALAQAKTVSPSGCIGLITNEQLCEQDELSDRKSVV